MFPTLLLTDAFQPQRTSYATGLPNIFRLLSIPRDVFLVWFPLSLAACPFCPSTFLASSLSETERSPYREQISSFSTPFAFMFVSDLFASPCPSYHETFRLAPPCRHQISPLSDIYCVSSPKKTRATPIYRFPFMSFPPPLCEALLLETSNSPSRSTITLPPETG